MKTNERDEQILSILRQQRFASVNSLAETLYTSPSSIRRDLNRLEAAGIVERSYGGVILLGDGHTAAPFVIRGEQNRLLKKEIAAKASVLLRDNLSVILDDSTTAFYMLEHLARFRNISLFTNNLSTAQRAIELSIKTYMIGGTSTGQSVVMCGSYALDMLDRIYADLCFFSSFALADNGDISDCTEESTAVRRKMLERADVRAFLCDSTKFHTRATHLLCNVSAVEHVFSDQPLPAFT